jgi:16S rRNA (uracil1498-N3)-methyltransferase
MGGGCGNASLPAARRGPIIRHVAQFRRLHVPALRVGELTLDPAQARHARGALRLEEGAEVEVFDEAGNVATGILAFSGARGASVRVMEVHSSAGSADSAAFSWSIASAVPKGERADWMVEKLSELGAAAFIPLITARSVVHPEGRGKRDRWQRLATESAKQSRRVGVMRIEELTKLEDAVGAGTGWYLSPSGDAIGMSEAIATTGPSGRLQLFIGPEGGWTPQEEDTMRRAGLKPVRLTDTILRTETAAVAAAAVVAILLGARDPTAPPASRPH